MANPEHLKILKQGVGIWNKWREVNPHLKPDLSGADLTKTGFTGISGTNLSGADLRETCGYGLLIHGTNFSDADLRKAYFQDCKFFKANFRNANLSESRFWECGFPNANFEYANLKKANLYMSVLGANFHGADMRDADLSCCLLIHAVLKEANITGVHLWGTVRDFWKIKDVKCDYVYWDGPAKQRCPKERDFEQGEFEQLYMALPTIEYIFENWMLPIDLLIMNRVVKAIQEKHPEFDIKTDSINSRGLTPSIKFTVRREEHKEPALVKVSEEYQIKHAQLEGKIEEINRHIRNLIDRPNTINIINAPQAKYLAIDGSTLNVQETSNYYAFELHKAIEQEPEESESFAKVAKKTALDIIGGVMKEIAKGQVKEAAKQIIELGKDLGPLFLKMAPAAYMFFKSML
ncbi:MAG: pentapeptide repeat-containing protein [Phycisphaerae bacterium]|jgi:hypothetical protein